VSPLADTLTGKMKALEWFVFRGKISKVVMRGVGDGVNGSTAVVALSPLVMRVLFTWM